MNESQLPRDVSSVIDAFRALEAATDIGVLLADDGFDAVTMRVFAAFDKSSHEWTRPERPMPDSRPTNAVWEWMIEGFRVDYAAIADGAGVALEVARERMMTLVRARLVYPDGSSSKHARQALQATVASRLVKAGAKKSKAEKADGKAN